MITNEPPCLSMYRGPFLFVILQTNHSSVECSSMVINNITIFLPYPLRISVTRQGFEFADISIIWVFSFTSVT